MKNPINPTYLITSPVSQSGGVASFVKNITPFLGEKTMVFRRGRASISEGRLRQISNSIALPFRFIHALRTSKAERILINSSLSTGSMLRDGLLIRLAKMKHRKVVLFVHGFQEKDLRHKSLLKCGYFRADHILVLANEFKELLLKAGCSKPISISLNPVNEELLNQTTNTQLNENLHNILFLSRIEKAKGIFEALECFRLIQMKHPEVTFNIVGDGGARKEAEQWVDERQIKNVVFHGFKSGAEKINQLKSNLLLLLLTSHREGLPITVLEAMTAGEIVLTRTVGGLVDLHAECDFGYITQSMNPADFSEAFERFYSNPTLAKETRLRNQEFARSHFHPEIVANNIKRIFDAL